MQTTIAAPPKFGPVTSAEIRQSLADTQRLIASGRLNDAASLLWPAFESAVRLSLTDLARQTDAPIGISDTPQGLSTQAVAYGVIGPEDRDTLRRFLSLREAAARGDAELVDVGLLQEVSRFAERTLDELEQHN